MVNLPLAVADPASNDAFTQVTTHSGVMVNLPLAVADPASNDAFTQVATHSGVMVNLPLAVADQASNETNGLISQLKYLIFRHTRV